MGAVLKPNYYAHWGFVAPAKARAEIWRTLLGVVLVVVIYVALTQIYFAGLVSLVGAEARGAFLAGLERGATPLAMLALLFNFGLITIAVGLVVVILHRRPPMSVLGPVALLRDHFIKAMVALLLLQGVLVVLPPWGMGTPLEPGLALPTWLGFLPAALLAILVQTSAEEVLFRGYIQQQLAARIPHPVVWMGLPSIIFGMAHYAPDAAGDHALLVAIWACVFGLLMADLTARSGSLGPAIAVHFVNNAFAMLVISVPDDLFGLALYVTPFSMHDAAEVARWLPVDFGVMIVSWLAVRLAIKR